MTISFFSCSSLPGKAEPVTEMFKAAQQTYALGKTQFSQGQYGSALGNFESALYQYGALDEGTGIIKSLLAMGKSAVALGLYDRALACYGWALPLAEERGDRELIRDTANHYGNCYLAQGDAGEAERWLNYGEPYGEPSLVLAEYYRLKGTIAKRKGDYEEAVAQYGKALEIDGQIPESTQAGTNLYLTGSAYSLMGNYAEAESALLAALERDREFELLPGIAADLLALGVVTEKSGRRQEAFLYYRRAYLAWKGLGNGARMDELRQKMENIGEGSLVYP